MKCRVAQLVRLGADPHGLIATSEKSRFKANNELVKEAVEGDSVKIILNRTPFYAESGGQIGDKGLITSQDLEVSVENVRKKKNIFIHYGIVKTGVLTVNSLVQMNVTPSFPA